LNFATGSAGTESSSGDADPFSYVYEKKSNSTASLVVRFKSDKWDEYDLTFAPSGTGTLVLREFKNNRLDRTRSGTFSLVPTP
jgi:hypothetical protein